MQHKSTITRLLLALTLVFLLVFAAVPALAVAYNYDVTAGGVLTVNVGDTIYMTNSHSTSGMVLSAYGRSSSNSSIVAIESGYSSRNATMKAVAPGTVTIKGELTGAFQIENYGTKYNSATGKYEQYKYYTTQSYTYPLRLQHHRHRYVCAADHLSAQEYACPRRRQRDLLGRRDRPQRADLPVVLRLPRPERELRRNRSHLVL